MEGNKKQPATIFEQMVLGQQVTNENIVTLSEDLHTMHAKLDALLAIFTTPPMKAQDNSEPDASGAETQEQ